MGQSKVLFATLGLESYTANIRGLYLQECLSDGDFSDRDLVFDSRAFYRGGDVEGIVENIDSWKPEVLIFSCFVWSVAKILRVGELLKKHNPDVKVVLTGPYASSVPEKLLAENYWLDAVLTGPAENVLPDLLEEILWGTDSFNEVSGVAFGRGERAKVDSGERSRVFKNIPLPEFSCGCSRIRGKSVELEIQRGCSCECGFCSLGNNYYGGGQGEVEFLELSTIEASLREIYSCEIKNLVLRSPVFNLELERSKEIARMIARFNSESDRAWARIRPENVDREFARLLKQARMGVVVELQTITDQVSSEVSRVYNPAEFERGYTILKQEEVLTSITLTPGLPGETYDSFKDSINYALNLEPTLLAPAPVLVSPGSYLWRNAEKLDLVYSADPPHELLSTGDLSREKLLELTKLLVATCFLWRGTDYLKSRVNLVELAEEWTSETQFWRRKNRGDLGIFPMVNEFEAEQNFTSNFPEYARFLFKSGEIVKKEKI